MVGFGVTDAARFAEARDTLFTNRDSGMAGPLRFTYGDPETATDVKATYPWAKSLVVVAHSYLRETESPADRAPQVGRFATADHYRPLREATAAVAAELIEQGFRAEVLIDDNRLVDRAVAIRAGVGWLGLSTMVLVPGHGPWTLLGTVATDAPLDTTPPMERTCGTCTECIPACPTGAITARGVDARRCISAWLQAPGHLPHWIRPHVGTRIYGCDDCLTSCPPGHPPMNKVKVSPSHLEFAELLGSEDPELRERFAWWYIPNRDPRFLRRNVVVAAGNSGSLSLSEAIESQFEHRSSLVRGHAYWAYARLLGVEAWHRLEVAYRRERFPDAASELERAFLMLRRPTV